MKRSSILVVSASIVSITTLAFYWFTTGDNSTNSIIELKKSHKIQVEKVELSDSGKQIQYKPIVYEKDNQEKVLDEPEFLQELQLSESDKKIFSDWKETRGYFLIDRSNYPNDVHLYKKHADDYLLGLATNGDSVAQLYYGIRMLGEDNEQAAEWLKESIISGGYSKASNLLSTMYSNQILMQSIIESEYEGDSDMNNNLMSEESLEKLKMEGYKWALFSQKRNDLYAVQLIDQSIYNDISESQRAQISAQVDELYSKMMNERLGRGLQPFSNDALPARISDLYYSQTKK